MRTSPRVRGRAGSLGMRVARARRGALIAASGCERSSGWLRGIPLGTSSFIYIPVRPLVWPRCSLNTQGRFLSFSLFFAFLAMQTLAGVDYEEEKRKWGRVTLDVPERVPAVRSISTAMYRGGIFKPWLLFRRVQVPRLASRSRAQFYFLGVFGLLNNTPLNVQACYVRFSRHRFFSLYWATEISLRHLRPSDLK